VSYFDNFPSNKKTEPPFPANTPVSRNESPPSGDVGIELEIEGVGFPENAVVHGAVTCPTTGSRWLTHNDGSLRGGIEYVLSVPCKIDAVPEMVTELYSTLRNSGAVIRNTNRCSTHVHVNVSDWKANLLTSFIVAWAAIEPALVAWCGIERKSNHFCLGIKDTPANIYNWGKFLETGRFDMPNGLKYTALNLLHIRDFGSLESRIGMSPDNPGDVIDWTRLMWGIREYVREYFNNPESVPQAVSEMRPSGLLRAICDVSGTTRIYDEILTVLPEEEIDKSGYESFRDAQVLCYNYPWSDWLPYINKPYIPSPFKSKKDDRGLEEARIRLRNTAPRAMANWDIADPVRPRDVLPVPEPIRRN
jgi:Putative amidoligase enzyme